MSPAMRMFLALVLFTAGCAKEAEVATPKVDAKAKPAEIRIEDVAVPAGAGAAEPFLFATRDSLLLSWLEPVADTGRVALRFSRHRNGAWSAPETIVERDDLFVNWADFPSVIEDTKGTLFAHWLQKRSGATYSYDVWMATSAGGNGWGKPFLLNRDGKNVEHGFATMAPLPNGGIGVTWLDGRAMSEGGDHEEHDAGNMSLRYATVDARGQITDEVELDDRTCECCATGMAMTGAGPVIFYRDRSPEEIRDVAYVSRTVDGWTKPALLRADPWKIAACPVNGPQADAIGNSVITAWFTAPEGKAQVLAAFSSDGGRTFGKTLTIDAEQPIGRVDVVQLDATTALVTWLAQTPAGGELRARRIRSDGSQEPPFRIASSTTARAAGFARLAKLGPDVYVAWTNQEGANKSIRVARIRP